MEVMERREPTSIILYTNISYVQEIIELKGSKFDQFLVLSFTDAAY